MCSPVDEFGRSRRSGVDGLVGEKDCVTGGLGELLDAGSDISGVADQGELEVASPADGAGDHHTGVDADADAKFPSKPLGNQAMNQDRGGHGGIGMIEEIVWGTKDRQRAVTEELVDVPTRIDYCRHHDSASGDFVR
jgi:hypothetical protein